LVTYPQSKIQNTKILVGTTPLSHAISHPVRCGLNGCYLPPLTEVLKTSASAHRFFFSQRLLID